MNFIKKNVKDLDFKKNKTLKLKVDLTNNSV